MKSAITFLQERALLAKSGETRQTQIHQVNSAELPQAIRDAAKRGWNIFPVLTGSLNADDADALIETATNDISILEDLPTMYPDCRYGLLTGPDSGVWVAEMNGPRGAAVLYDRAGVSPQFADELWDGQTLLSRGGTRTYAYFKWPDGFSMKHSHRSDPSLILHGDCSWVPLPPSLFSGVISHIYMNDAAVAKTPEFLVDLLFKPLNSKSGSAALLKFPSRPTYPGLLPGMRRTDVFGGERKLLQFPGPAARRNMLSIPRRR